MAIWLTGIPELERLNQMRQGSMLESLDIRFTRAGDDFLEASMPVDRRTIQPFGILHGGASVALAETLGSVASVLCVDSRAHTCVGLEINANHIRAVREGVVTGRVTPIHLGRSTHVWEIHIRDQQDRLVSICRLTMAILPARR